MLHLILGSDRLQLTEQILYTLSGQAELGREGQILIVPEQFSHEAERRLCAVGGDTISRYAEVLSLSRLADRVAASVGGAAKSYLDQGGRMLTMALAAEQISSRLKLFGGVLRKPEFLSELLTMVDEFQGYCISPQDLLDASAGTDGRFAQKLEELGLIYEAYLTACENGDADPAGRLLRLREALERSDWAKGHTFYVDGFSYFITAELAILEVLLQQGCHVWVALRADGPSQLATGPAKECVKKLQDMAAKWEIPIETVPAGVSVDRDPAVSALLHEIFLSEPRQLPASDHIGLRVSASVEDECRGTAMEIKALLSKGARCRDIAIACAAPELYEASLRAALKSADLPFYYAGSDDILGKPIIHSVLCSLQAAVGTFDYEDVALYLKSGLPLPDRDSLDRLDGYAYLWNLRGAQWEQPWVLHPSGFGLSWSEDDQQRLQKLNEEKDLALKPLFRLRHGLQTSKNTGDMVQCVYEFLEQLQLRQRLEQRANAVGGQLGQELFQLYDILCRSLEQIWLVLGETVRTPDDFAGLYRSLLTQYSVGTIPAGIDQIYVGALRELRQKKTRHLFVLGASDGSFPSYQNGEGLLTEQERRQLFARGLTLAPLQSDQMELEMSHIYDALSAATETLHLSYSGDQPAWLFRRAAALYPASLITDDREYFLDLPSLAAWRLRHGVKEPAGLAELDAIERSLRLLREYDWTPLPQEAVEGLYGHRIYLSASRIDKFAACQFAFFLAYGLKAEPRKQASMDPSAFGTFVHAVLQNTVERVMSMGGFQQVNNEELVAIAKEEIGTYAREFFPQQEQRAAFLFHRSELEILDIVADVGEELRRSKFYPVDCELEFSAKGDLPVVEIMGKNASCRISGFVDRVDLYEHEGQTYVRVVDYKTGHKDFDYTDILNGAGLQMLIYLFALKEYGAEHYGGRQLIPAGVLYLPARKEYALMPPAPNDLAVMERHRKDRRRKGLIRSDDDLLAAMEEDPENPVYMPYTVGKNGPDGGLASQRQMALLENHVMRTLSALTDRIFSGSVTPDPVVRGQNSSCRYCDYRTVCHMDLCRHNTRVMAATDEKKFWEKLEEENVNG